jgi:hypothetical protein
MRQAARCETAFNDKCRCRCGGRFHGARRVLEPDRAMFEALPEDDPHHVQPKPARKPRVLKRDRVPPLFEGIEV